MIALIAKPDSGKILELLQYPSGIWFVMERQDNKGFPKIRLIRTQRFWNIVDKEWGGG